jgi:hypothetical protein
MNENYVYERTTWGIHLILKENSPYPLYPEWANKKDTHSWKSSGVVVWDRVAHRILCLSPHQALDVLDDLRESSTWKSDGILLSWNSYSLPFSEDARKRRQSQENRRNLYTDGKLREWEVHFNPTQAQGLFDFLESHHEEIREMADRRSREAKVTLGQVYSLILSWTRESKQESHNPSNNK